MNELSIPRYPWLDEFLMGLPGAEKDYKVEWGWHRYMVGGKLFAAVCAPDEKHAGYGGHVLVNLKCEPLLSEALRLKHPEILPGFYCDKRCWIAVFLDAEIADELLSGLCKQSYRLVFEKLTKKLQREITDAAALKP